MSSPAEPASVLRELQRSECALLARIDRSERIREEYVLVDGALEIRSCDIDVVGWRPGQLADSIPRLQATIESGGFVVGAWHRDELIGLASLEAGPVGGNPKVAKLDMLYVSRSRRHRGVGRSLTSAVAARARAQGITSLYISATPTRNTVDAYVAMGAAPVGDPDAHLFSLEPDDIHLILPIYEPNPGGGGSIPSLSSS